MKWISKVNKNLDGPWTSTSLNMGVYFTFWISMWVFLFISWSAVTCTHHKCALGKPDLRTQQQISQKLQITLNTSINLKLLWYTLNPLSTFKKNFKIFITVKYPLLSMDWGCASQIETREHGAFTLLTAQLYTGQMTVVE